MKSSSAAKPLAFSLILGEGGGAFGLVGEFSGNGENRRHVADAFHREIRHVAEDDGDVVGIALVRLLDDEDDAFERFAGECAR